MESEDASIAKAEGFEDLVVWQEARLLRKEVSAASKESAFAKDFEMRGQIRSAALSVMNNIVGGFERGSNKEFAQFLNIAKGSVGEVRSVLDAALDDNYLSQREFDRLYDRALFVTRRCSRFITYLVNAQRTRPNAPAGPNPNPAPPGDLTT